MTNEEIFDMLESYNNISAIFFGKKGMFRAFFDGEEVILENLVTKEQTKEFSLDEIVLKTWEFTPQPPKKVYGESLEDLAQNVKEYFDKQFQNFAEEWYIG